MPLRSLVRRLSKLGAADWADLVRAQSALIVAQLLVSTRAPGRLVESGSSPVRDAETDAAARARAARIALSVSRAAAYGLFRPLCLVRALALHRMLEARRIRGSRVRIGVRWREGRFDAHAWVEYDNRILGDTSERTAGFSQLTDVRMAAGR